MKRLVLCVAMLVLSGVGPATGAPILWSIASGGSGHYYEWVNCYTQERPGINWPTAEVAAESRIYLGVSGHLVTITSAAENEFVFQNLERVYENGFGAWIGLTDAENYGLGAHESSGQPNPLVDGWVWVTGEPVSYTNWQAGDPNNFSNEDYAIMGSIGQWGDAWDALDSNYIVEYDTPPNAIPEPSTLIVWSLLGASGVAIGWWRGRRAA